MSRAGCYLSKLELLTKNLKLLEASWSDLIRVNIAANMFSACSTFARARSRRRLFDQFKFGGEKRVEKVINLNIQTVPNGPDREERAFRLGEKAHSLNV